MFATPYSDLNSVLQELVDSQRALLGDAFLGAYLQGSFAVGGFDEHSDVDWLVVIECPLTAKLVEALQTMHGRIFDLECEWSRHLEGSYLPKDWLRDYRKGGRPIWYLDNGHRSLIESEHDNTVVVRWQVRENGIVLAGPSPDTLIDPIPVAALRQEMFDTMIGWGQQIMADPEMISNHFYQTFAVLHYCRTLHDLVRGRCGSKPAAAAWAKANLDPSWAGLIDRTWAGRPNPAVSVRTPADPQDLRRTLAFIEYAMELGREFMRTGQMGK